MPGGGVESESPFVELDMTAHAALCSSYPAPAVSSPGGLFTATRVDLTLSDGCRLLIEGPTALSAIVGLVEVSALDPGSVRHAGMFGCGRDGHAAWLQHAGRSGRERIG